MKIVKHYWFVAIALITMISFSSCESDEERGFDISGLYGKTWWGDMGFEDRYGEPLYSYITFTSGAFTDHGVGTEERCYHNDELYRVYKFDWEIQNGWLYLLKSATKLFSVLLASKRPLITELADKLRLKYPLLPTISPCPTMRLEAIRSIIPISCRRYPKSV